MRRRLWWLRRGGYVGRHGIEDDLLVDVVMKPKRRRAVPDRAARRAIADQELAGKCPDAAGDDSESGSSSSCSSSNSCGSNSCGSSGAIVGDVGGSCSGSGSGDAEASDHGADLDDVAVDAKSDAPDVAPLGS